MWRRFVVLLLCILLPVSLVAAPTIKKTPVKHPLTLQTDTSAVNVHQFEAKKIRAYTNDKDFQYDNASVPGESLWTIFWRWVWTHLFRHLFGANGSGTFFYYLFLSFGVIFLIFLLFKIAGINPVQIIRGNAKAINIPYSESLENINIVDFDSEIDKAISKKNYRLAVRLLYLSSLKQLSDIGLINWQIEKTNHTYINEIPDGKKKQVFSLLTRQFEYVWYGDFHIDDSAFQNIRSLFQQFKQTL